MSGVEFSKRRALELIGSEPSLENLLSLISWIDINSAEYPDNTLPMEILVRAVIAAAYAMKVVDSNLNIDRTIEAAEAYAIDPSDESFEILFTASTNTYPFGPGEGCYSVPETGYGECEVGSGCRSGSGCLRYFTHYLGELETMTAIQNELIPWLKRVKDPVLDREQSGSD